MLQRFRITYRDTVYFMVTAGLLLPGAGAFREIFQLGPSVIGFPHMVGILMYLIYLFWFVGSFKRKIEIVGDTLTVRTFWKTHVYSFGNGVDVLEVFVPIGKPGMNVATNYAHRLRIEDSTKKNTIDLMNLRKYDTLKSVLEEKAGAPLRQEYIKASVGFKVLDFFM